MKTDELKMNSKTFDKIMRQALRVQPEEAPKKKRTLKAKPARKKTTAK